MLGGIVTTGSAVALALFLGNFEDEFEDALRFCLDTVAVSLGIGASRLKERVVGILCVIALSNNCMYQGEMTRLRSSQGLCKRFYKAGLSHEWLLRPI